MRRITAILIAVIVTAFIFNGSYGEEKKLSSSYINEGIALFQQGNYLEAILSLRSAEQLTPNPVPVYKYLGLAYAGLSLWQPAAQEFDKLLMINPSDPERKLIVDDIHDWETRTEYIPAMAKYSFYSIKYKNRIWQDPNNLLNYLSLTEIYKCSGRYEEAENFFKALVKERPENLTFKKYMAEAFLLDKKYAESATIYKKVLDVEPLNIDANLGLDLIMIQRYKDQLAKYPNMSSVYLKIARLYRDMKRYEDAVDMYNKYLETDSANVEALRELAETKKISDALTKAPENN